MNMHLLPQLAALFQIILIDIALAGDNAITIGLAAAGLPEEQRHKAVTTGILAATVLRILFAIFAVQLLHITGLLAAGGLLLLWVSWKMFMDIRRHRHNKLNQDNRRPAKSLMDAILQIVIADVSMSLDNVLAVAGVARDHIIVLIIGLTLSVMLMGAASAVVARLTARFPWIAYAGLLIVLYTAANMIWEGSRAFY
jgi:YjbE family integral membrane protein